MGIFFSETMLTDCEELPSIKLGDFTLEFELGPPSAELQEVAKKDLRETPELQKQAVAQLRELLKGNDDFVWNLISRFPSFVRN